MNVAVVSIGSFDTQYSDYHLMRDIILGLLERGHTVTLVQKQYLNEPRYPERFSQYMGETLFVHNLQFEKKDKGNLKARYLADLSYYRKVCVWLRHHKPDKIFLQSNNTAFYTVFYSKYILKCPLLYNEQDIFPENALFAGILNEKSPIYQVAHALQKYAYQNATTLNTISDDMKHTIVTRYGIPEDKVQVIYNWGHEELKAHSEAENTFLQKYPKKTREFRVVYAGNLGKMQNVELLLEAAELMRGEADISFYIVGSGANEHQLKMFTQEKRLTNVTFAGMQPPEEVADLYAAADVNVIPLKENLIYAALPSKIADCLLAAKPIITCVNKDSSLAHLVKSYGIDNVEPDAEGELVQSILKIKESKEKTRYEELLEKQFNKNKSVHDYCVAIEQMELKNRIRHRTGKQ